MNGVLSQALAIRCAELEAEYARAHEQIQRGQLIPLTPCLRQSLQVVAANIQEAIQEGLTLTAEDLAMLCAAQAQDVFQSRPSDEQAQCDYGHTLYQLSQQLYKPARYPTG